MIRTMILPVITKADLSGIRLDCFEIPGGVVFQAEGKNYTPLSYRAEAQYIGDGMAIVRLCGVSLNGAIITLHAFRTDSMGEAGLWCTWWCEGGLGRI